MKKRRTSGWWGGPWAAWRHAAAAGMLWTGLAAVGGGCAGPQAAPLPPAASPGEGPVVVPAAGLSAESVSVAVGARVLLRSRLADGGSLLIERGALATGPQARWPVRRSTGPGPEGPWTVQVEQAFVLTPEGHAAIAEIIDHEEQVELVFSPPMVVMPVRLDPDGGVFEQSLSMRVHPIGDRGRLKAEGPLKQTIRHVGGAMVAGESPESGGMPAQCVEQVFRASLKPAEVVNTTRQWFVPGVGMIAEDAIERTRVFGIPTRNNRTSWVARPMPPLP